MLGVCVVVPLPVLVAGDEPLIGRWAWALLLLVTLVATVVAAVGARRATAAYLLALALGWTLLLTAPHLSLVPVLLVVLAALCPEALSLRWTSVVVPASSLVVLLAALRVGEGWTGALVTAGFYLLVQGASVLSVVGIAREQRLRADLAAAHVELQAQSVLLAESSRSAERLRVSRDLHDLMGHQLTVLALELEAARHREGEAVRPHVERADGVARSLLADVRRTVGRLREAPPDLEEALALVGRDVPGLDVRVHVGPGAAAVGDPATTEALLRAMQEVVTNTLRHGRASRLVVAVEQADGVVTLTAHDDGVGAARVSPGHGLRGLRERFEALGGGTRYEGREGFRVEAWVPSG